jgi:predicted GIY-YIG superfamily endonuclease
VLSSHLVYFEHFNYIEHAIDREKEIKIEAEKKKEDLIGTSNPD